MHFLENIDWVSKRLPDYTIYFFSFLGFAFLPAYFGRKLWWLVLWFLLVNAAFFWRGDFLNWRSPVVFILLGQLPWLLFTADLLFGGRLSGKVAAVPMRQILLWQISRLMGLHFFLAIYGGYAPIEFALEIGFSEITTALGAILLFVIYSPDRKWFQILLIFWNTYGLTAALSAEYKIFLSNPRIPFAYYSREIFQYATSYPQSWMYCFWFPLAIGMHATIFYKLYLNRNSGAALSPAEKIGEDGHETTPN